MKLTRKFTLGLVAGIIFIHLGFGLIRYKRESTLFRTDTARDAKVLGRTLALSAEKVWQSLGDGHALDLITHADLEEKDVGIRWISVDHATGTVQTITTPGKAETQPENGDDPTPVHASYDRLLTLPRHQPVVLESDGREPALYTYAAVYTDNVLRGAIEIRNAMIDERAYQLASIRNIALSTGMMVTFCLVLVWTLGWRLIGQPLRILCRQAEQVGQGDLSGRISIDQNDEIGELAREMNRMCDGLAEAATRVAEETKNRIAALEQLKHADRLRTVGALASGLAHELGTPLNVIEGYAQLSREDPASSQSTRDHAEIIIRQTKRMARIIRQLLDFARRGVAERMPADLRQIVKETIDMVEPIARKGEVTIEMPESDRPAVARIARGEFQQVLTNILINGIQAMPEGGTLTVDLQSRQATPPDGSMSASGEYLCVAIQDTGIGMNEETRARIFEPFFTTKDVGEGTGLGLSVAHGIVHDHGGWIEVDSHKGGGSRFAIYLPVEEEA